MSLQAGLDALQQGQYQQAVEVLEQFCLSCSDSGSKEYLQAQMGLVKAYHSLGQTPRAIGLVINWRLANNQRYALGQNKPCKASPLAKHQYPNNPTPSKTLGELLRVVSS